MQPAIPEPRAARQAPLARLRRAWRGPHEIALFVLAYLVYFGVRAVTEGSVPAAIEHGKALLDFERELALDWERNLQDVILDREWLIDAANAVYIYGHWPVLIFGGIVLFKISPRRYYRLRNVILISGGLGLFVFASFPVAPPRLADVGVLDTVTLEAGTYRDVLPPTLVNEYAALPSFHAGWNLLLGITLFGASRNLLSRLFAVLMPPMMAFAVVATANHYVIDVIAGAAVVLLALWLVVRLERHWGAGPRLERHGPNASYARGAGATTLRGRPSGG